jgi:hypothetical protein
LGIAKKAVLKPQGGAKAERQQRQCFRGAIAAGRPDRGSLDVSRGTSSGAPNHLVEFIRVIDPRPSWTRKWQALDPAAERM